MTTLAELSDEMWGPVGTPRRDSMDRIIGRWLRAERIAYMVTRHWPEWMRIFWMTPIYDRTLHPRAFLDVMSFSYLGDFLFAGRPITQSYHDSWMSRVHFPSWLHITRRST